MATGFWGIEWLNLNSQRSYPFAHDATQRDLSDTFTVPNSLILALYLPVSAGLDVDPEKFFIRSLTIFSVGLNVSVAYDNGDPSPPIVATTVVAFSTHKEYNSYAMPGANNFDDIVGKIVIGSVDNLQSLPPGQYLFDYEGGKLDSDCIRPILRGLSSITLINGSDRSAKIYGDVEFAAGTNMRITPIIVPGQPTEIRFDAISGEGLLDECVCDEEQPGPIRTINGVPPTADGRFTLLGNDCLDITAINNGLQLLDNCSLPCCGCSELEAVTRDLEKFGEAATTLTNFLNRLETSVTQMNLVVLGSKLNDRGCVETI